MSKYKLKNLNFDSVDEFLDYLPDDERIIVDYLRSIIHDCIPEVREKLAYNVPYYYRHSRICFIWPSSVPWGNVPQYGVQLGFCKGNLLSDPDYYLEKRGRKKVFIKTFVSINEIQTDYLRAFLFEAVEVDEALKANKGIIPC